MAHPVDASLLGPDVAESEFRDVNGIRMHVGVAGPVDGPLVVLLHGFPEFWYGWHHQIRPLVEAGFRVLVPDQRGYNLSERPPAVADYRISLLAGDIRELIASEGRESACVVGHDWGAMVAWYLACAHPQCVNALVVCNVPHPSAFRKLAPRRWRQIKKSWYALFFQLPWLPEWMLEAGHFRSFRAVLAKDARPGSFTETDLWRYRSAWQRSGGVGGMVNWYRSAVRHRETPQQSRVAAPTLILWGVHDSYLIAELAEASLEYCEQGRLVWFDEASHWLHHEFPDEVTQHIIEHCKKDKSKV